MAEALCPADAPIECLPPAMGTGIKLRKRIGQGRAKCCQLASPSFVRGMREGFALYRALLRQARAFDADTALCSLLVAAPLPPHSRRPARWSDELALAARLRSLIAAISSSPVSGSAAGHSDRDASRGDGGGRHFCLPHCTHDDAHEPAPSAPASSSSLCVPS